MKDRVFWIITRILAAVALIGFIIVGLAFALYPNAVTGSEVTSSSSLWHSLTLAFMATVSMLALLVVIEPKRYLDMLLPLFIGKLVSSLSSLYWYIQFSNSTLLTNTFIDGAIAVMALILYLFGKRHR